MKKMRFLESIVAVMLAGCGATGAETPRMAPPPASLPPPAAPLACPTQSHAPVAQEFADGGSEPAFRDPERRTKLAAAFPKIDEIAEEELKLQDIPGMAIGVVIDGELAYEKGFGVANLDTNAKPDADTVYRIGSITKSFTAMALLALRDEGLLSLDDPLSKWIPEARGLVYPTRDAPPVTLRHMLTHTSGLPREGTFSRNTGPSEETIVKSLASFWLENAPGTKYVYSNLGFGLLGIVAGHADHAPFRDVMKKRLLGPLGMTSTVWDRESVPSGRLAAAYVKNADGKLSPVDHWVLGRVEGCGGLYSTVRDMAKYVAFQLAAYPPRSAPEALPIKRASAREAHFNTVSSGLSVRLSDAPRKGESIVNVNAVRYGYGWVSQQTCEFDELVWHNGGTEGYRTDIAFLPGQGVGIIVLTNASSGSPEIVVNRALLALHRSGGLSKRTVDIPPVFEPAMKRFLDVYNTWNEAGYKAMVTPEHAATWMREEIVELEGYKNLHGVCKGFSLVEVRVRGQAVFKMDCERGTLIMDVGVTGEGLINAFTGTSRDLPVPPELRKIADRVAGLVKKWDEGVYKKHLALAKRPRDEAARLFDDLRSVHGACAVKSLTNVVSNKKLVLQCERGGDLTLALTLDPKNADTVTAFAFQSLEQGTCPVR